MADFQECTIADLKYRFKDLGAQTAAFRVLTKFESMHDQEIEGCLSTLAESYDMDPISLATEFENWMDIYEDENFNSSIEALGIFASIVPWIERLHFSARTLFHPCGFYRTTPRHVNAGFLL